jgi:hypothetical protein
MSDDLRGWIIQASEAVFLISGVGFVVVTLKIASIFWARNRAGIHPLRPGTHPPANKIWLFLFVAFYLIAVASVTLALQLG